MEAWLAHFSVIVATVFYILLILTAILSICMLIVLIWVFVDYIRERRYRN